MKRYIAVAVIASAFLVGVISGCKKESTVTTPVLEDGTQYATTDNGKTWRKIGNNCANACQCVTSHVGQEPSGTCIQNGVEKSCADWCDPTR